MTHPERDYSYEAFAGQEFYKEIDRGLIKRAPVVHSVLDMATGTGAVVEQLFEQGRILEPYRIMGVDLDEEGLGIARSKFPDNHWVRFIQGDVTDIPEIPSGSVDLVTIFNSIHLFDDPQKALQEAGRIVKPQGTLLVNSAYVKGVLYPEGTQRAWGLLVALARKKIPEELIAQTGHSVNFDRFSMEEYEEMVRMAGFSDVTTEIVEAPMNENAFRAICSYHLFAEGAFPNIPIEISSQALVDSVGEMFDRSKSAVRTSDTGERFIPRNWMYMIAQKS